jgi:hypothetical protein
LERNALIDGMAVAAALESGHNSGVATDALAARYMRD